MDEHRVSLLDKIPRDCHENERQEKSNRGDDRVGALLTTYFLHLGHLVRRGFSLHLGPELRHGPRCTPDQHPKNKSYQRETSTNTKSAACAGTHPRGTKTL